LLATDSATRDDWVDDHLFPGPKPRRGPEPPVVHEDADGLHVIEVEVLRVAIDVEGRITKAVLIVRDVTERRLAEDSLVRYR
jgi:PAS domain-containing protein